MYDFIYRPNAEFCREIECWGARTGGSYDGLKGERPSC